MPMRRPDDRHARAFRARPRRGFSLIEVVITLAIIATVAAIAAPRVTRAVDGADVAATEANLQHLNRALELYRAEHGRYPKQMNIAQQLTMCSNQSGSRLASAPNPDEGVIYGPYLVKIPPLPVGPLAGATGISTTPSDGTGWIYSNSLKQIFPNFGGADGRGDSQLADLFRLPDLTPLVGADDEGGGGALDLGLPGL